MDELITLEFDGGSRGNPGPAGVGVVLRAADGTPLITLGRYIGQATNNVAEYRALIIGLEQALRLQAKKLVIRGDSELIIKQMRGEYRVKNAQLRVLHQEAQRLYRQFATARLEHNLRHRNALADKLANLAMDRKGEVTDADEPSPSSLPLSSPAPSASEIGAQFACPRCGCEIELKQESTRDPQDLGPFRCQCGTAMSPKE